MIHKGFIRDVDGVWFGIHGLDRIVVERMEEAYPGDEAMGWEIQGVWEINGEDVPLVLEQGFVSMEAAQLFLDERMRD